MTGHDAEKLKTLYNELGFVHGWRDAKDRYVDLDEYGDVELAVLDDAVNESDYNELTQEYSIGFRSGWLCGKTDNQMSRYSRCYSGRQPKSESNLLFVIKRLERKQDV